MPDAPAKAITGLLLRNWPDAYCYLCLAGKLKLAEKQIREGAQVLILLPEFRVRQRVCAECGRQTEMLEMEVQGRDVVERVSPKTRGGGDPLCPVCLEPIKASDKVRGLQDDLMHEGCDYTRRETPPPKSPFKSPPRSN